MKASFESVKFSVRCRRGRGGHWQATRAALPAVVAPLARLRHYVTISWTGLGPGLGGTIIFITPWGLKMRHQRPRKIHSLLTLMTVPQLCGRRFQGAFPGIP